MTDNTFDTKSTILNNIYKRIIKLPHSLYNIKVLAFLLYLKQHDSLILIPENEKVDDGTHIASYGNKSLYCNKKIEFFTNDEFEELQYSIIYNIHEGEENQYAIELAYILNDVVLDVNDSLFLLDKVIAEFGRYDGIFCLPHELALIISSFVSDNIQRIYDPFGGAMELATTMTTSTRRFTANEINRQTRDIALFRLAIAGILKQTKIYNNPLKEWTEDVFDAIITMPPYGIKLQMSDRSVYGRPREKEESEQIAIQRFEKTTTVTGQLITVVPMSFLDRESSHMLREYITRKNLLDAIISLPQQLLFPSGVATAIIVLRKQRQEGEPIHLFDASKYEVNDNLHNVVNMNVVKHSSGENHAEISIDKLLKNSCSWNIGWYLYNHNIHYREGAKIVPLRDIFAIAPSTSHFNETKGHLVTGPVLSSASILHYEFNPEDFAESSDLKNARKITEPVVLISTLSTYFPVFCNASEKNPIYVKPSIDALIIKNDNLHVGYLCMELHDRLTELAKYVSFYSNRRIYKFISISLPPVIEQQKSLYNEKVKTIQEAKLKELGFKNTIEGYKKQFRARKHAISQNLSAMSALWNTLYRFKGNNDGHLKDSDIISQNYNKTVGDVFDAINERLKVVLLQVDHIADDEPDWGEPEAIELTAFIEDYIKTHSDIRFEYIHGNFDKQEYQKERKLIEDDAWAKIIFPKKALIRIFENIISNAIAHGFTDSNRNDYKIMISHQFIDADCWTINISNNGEPIPDSVDLKKTFDYGYTTKSSEGHSGLGAYQVEELMKQFGSQDDELENQGKVEIVSTPNDLFTVTYVLTFRKTNII